MGVPRGVKKRSITETCLSDKVSATYYEVAWWFDCFDTLRFCPTPQLSEGGLHSSQGTLQTDVGQTDHGSTSKIAIYYDDPSK